ncbi:MAG: hypothetical protein KBG09_05270 [Syntrophobacterales bacterium]|nr:hypothetical protein [Syntrophobacterales bacterium]
MSREDNMGHQINLQLAAEISFLPVVVQWAETAAKVFGLGREEALKICLATEEIFSYLSSRVCPGEVLDIRCMNGIFYVRVEFRFPVSILNMGALNVAAAVACDSEESLAEMGLALATRTVDRLNIFAERKNYICLAIEKDKEYPLFSATNAITVSARGKLAVTSPDAEGVKSYVARVARTSDERLPSFFRYPGKVADMVAGEEYQALTAVDSRGECVGGLIFHFRTPQLVEMYGPQVFVPEREAETAAMLFEDCLARTARTKAIGILNLTGVPASLKTQFEFLGSLTYKGKDDHKVVHQCHYRLLHEDPGAVVFTHAVLTDYLRREYSRLFLARDIREVTDQGETRTGYSIFATEFHREGSKAILRPLWPGVDFDANVQRHLRFLQEEGIGNVLFTIDLGVSWQASLMTVLMNNDFHPTLIVPFAGQSDLLYFQYD